MRKTVKFLLDCPKEGELLVLSDPALLLQYSFNYLVVVMEI